MNFNRRHQVDCVCCGVDTLAEVEVLKHSVTQLEASVVDAERDIQRKVQAVREEQWQKLHKVESEKCVILRLGLQINRSQRSD